MKRSLIVGTDRRSLFNLFFEGRSLFNLFFEGRSLIVGNGEAIAGWFIF